MVYSLGPCETLRLAFRFINYNIIEFLYIYLVVYLFDFDLTHLFIVLFIWSLVLLRPGNSHAATVRDSPQSTFPTSPLTIWYK